MKRGTTEDAENSKVGYNDETIFTTNCTNLTNGEPAALSLVSSQWSWGQHD
ncbi:hypothetical protein [Rubritalea tangerina]|uniref:hypothetical protein n=1 Tax=Rubritalea tangerina TaxID=430798 RepID=UPI00360D32E0